MDKPIIGITQGDINGIGFEIILKALTDPMILDICTPVIYGSPKVAAYYRKQLEMQNFNLNLITEASSAAHHKVNIINTSTDDLKVDTSRNSLEAGKAALSALEAAVKDAKEGKIAAIVTAPINRQAYGEQEEFKFIGHTEYLEQQFEAQGKSLQLMVGEVMRIASLTGHVPVSQVPSLITIDAIVEKVHILQHVLRRDFGINKPRIAVLGLNPHADSEEPQREELEIIRPAVKRLNDEKILCFGPLMADMLFGTGQFTRYDAILAMYHDQGMIPFKTLSMDAGVRMSANLPIIRTAPTHGTRYDIAGKNEASEESLRNALYLAVDTVHNRRTYDESTANPLKVSPASPRRER
ncbi:MAG: 4-hydroxythreonine-4-phosphate dehydrogenase PdxA [Paludibacteraceae bacterium]|nr:4-hydroxythreonine-4-phosphate dehydrogenase PdxA [Paludibacteraceae bacterium]